MGLYLKAGTMIWGHWKKDHEQGKLLRDYVPVIVEQYQGMRRIERVPDNLLDRKVLEQYTEYWIDPAYLVSTEPAPVPVPQPTTYSDDLAGKYFVYLFKWGAKVLADFFGK